MKIVFTFDKFINLVLKPKHRRQDTQYLNLNTIYNYYIQFFTTFCFLTGGKWFRTTPDSIRFSYIKVYVI